MSTKKPSDASAPLEDEWFLEDEDPPPKIKPAQPPPRTRKDRETISPLPKR